MQEAGDVLFTDVDSISTGIVEFERADAMKYAIRNLDGSKLKSHEVCIGWQRSSCLFNTRLSIMNLTACSSFGKN
jgi:hypothetical protein